MVFMFSLNILTSSADNKNGPVPLISNPFWFLTQICLVQYECAVDVTNSTQVWAGWCVHSSYSCRCWRRAKFPRMLISVFFGETDIHTDLALFLSYVGVTESFRTESITKNTLTPINSRWEAT